jgi:hypothetical protein
VATCWDGRLAERAERHERREARPVSYSSASSRSRLSLNELEDETCDRLLRDNAAKTALVRQLAAESLGKTDAIRALVRESEERARENEALAAALGRARE